MQQPFSQDLQVRRSGGGAIPSQFVAKARTWCCRRAEMIDHIVHDADVVAINGNSYRLRNTEKDTLTSLRTENRAQ